ncbi:MAG: hypothetical protein K0R59_134 [Sphingobacterium sp.]|jgi:hypothetical protein|nr:hypothetical protein [Sphingobacterium sp.]
MAIILIKKPQEREFYAAFSLTYEKHPLCEMYIYKTVDMSNCPEKMKNKLISSFNLTPSFL